MKEKCKKIEEDIYLVYKPRGISSFQLVRRFQNYISSRKAGHAGTLDPLAEGLMIIGVNGGTKKLKNYLGLDKQYLVEITIGESRTTGDSEGEILKKRNYAGDIRESDIESALARLLGKREYDAPLYSAVKVEGKPLYWYARKGKEIPYIPKKKFELKNYEFLSQEEGDQVLRVRLRVLVASGTYVRTLAIELGKLLGYPAYMSALLREKIGDYSYRDACRISISDGV